MGHDFTSLTRGFKLIASDQNNSLDEAADGEKGGDELPLVPQLLHWFPHLLVLLLVRLDSLRYAHP